MNNVFALARSVLAVAACMALATALTGCTGYRLGTTLPPGIESIYVPTLQNETNEPELETEVTRALVQEFQRDGTLRVASADDADATVEGVISFFELVPLRYERDRAKTTSEYRMRVLADVVFRQTGEEEPLFSRRLEGRTEFDFTGDLASSKEEALPAAAKDLAHDIVESIVEYW